VAGQREDDVEVARGEKLLLTRSDPAFSSTRLTLWAVPISARNGELPIMQSIFSLAARRHQV